MTIQYRKALPPDSFSLAELDALASGGVLDYLYHDLVPGKTPVEAAAEILHDENEAYSHASAIVAEIDGAIAGMIISYHSRFHALTGEITDFFPRDRVDQVRVLFEADVPESLYINSLCVHEQFRNRGIGGDLLDRAAEKAATGGFTGMSLITFTDNAVSHRLYRNHGFRIVRELPFNHHRMMPHHGIYVMATA